MNLTDKQRIALRLVVQTEGDVTLAPVGWRTSSYEMVIHAGTAYRLRDLGLVELDEANGDPAYVVPTRSGIEEDKASLVPNLA